MSPPAAMCDGNDVVGYEAAGTCTNNDGASSCEYTMMAAAPCGDGNVCVAGSCYEEGGGLDDFVFSEQASYLSAIAFPEKSDPCCFDYTDDGEPDNGLGDLVTQLAGLLGGDLPEGGVNGLLAEQIQDGSFAILFEYVDLDDATSDDDMAINGYFGEPVNPDYNANLGGEGDFNASLSSLLSEEPVIPLIAFNNAMIDGGVLSGGPSLFALNLDLGDLGFALDITIHDAKFTADATLGANGKGLDLTDGQLGGVVPMIQLADALNGLGGTCACFGLAPGEMMLDVPQEDKLGCTDAFKAADLSGCTEEDGSICSGIGGVKSLVCSAIGILKPDVDTDDTGKPDSFSIGLRSEAVSANIIGWAAEEPATDGM